MNNYNNECCVELTKKLHFSNLNECFYFPKYFTIETCNNCNAKCIMCPKGIKGIGSLQLMDDFLFQKIVVELSEYKDWIEMICLNSDGEPLLDKKIAERIKMLKSIGIKHVNISTNGALLSSYRIQELIESGLDDIRISIDGLKKQTYEKIRIGLDYDVVRENVMNLIKTRNEMSSKMSIRIRMVELKENVEERNDWLSYWGSQIGETDKVQIMPMHTWSGKIASEDSRQVEYYAHKPCISVFSSFTINYDGIVQLCDSDIEQQVIMGDVMKESIRDIWQGEKFEKIRKWHSNSERNNISICKGCDHWNREFREKSRKG